MTFDCEFTYLLLLVGEGQGLSRSEEWSIAGVADRTVCLMCRNAGSPVVFLLAACE